MRLIAKCVAVTLLVALFGNVVQAGILDLLGLDKFGPPLRTVYVVKPSHHHHEPPPKTVIKYISKPSSYSPFKFISNVFSSGGWGSPKPSGWGKPPMSMTIDEATYNKLLQGEGGWGEMSGQDGDEMMGQMMKGKPMMSMEEEPSVEMVSSGGHRGMRPPTSTMVMMSHKPMARGKPRPTSTKMSSRPTMVMMSSPEGPSEMMDDMAKPIKYTSKKPSSSSSSSGGSGWSSGPPKTVTYVTKGWGQPASGWGWESPSPSYGWSTLSYDDEEWPSTGGNGWGWESDDSGWEPDSPSSPAPEAPEEEMTTTTTEQPQPQEPEQVDEVVNTEEGEDRRQPTTPAPAPVPIAPSSDAAERFRPRPITTPLPKTSDPLPEEEEQISGGYGGPTGGYSDGPSGGYSDGPSGGYSSGPSSVGGGYSNSGSASNNVRSNSISNDFRIGDQVISNGDGLLDEDLIRTVQQIIQTFDKN